MVRRAAEASVDRDEDFSSAAWAEEVQSLQLLVMAVDAVMAEYEQERPRTIESRYPDGVTP